MRELSVGAVAFLCGVSGETCSSSSRPSPPSAPADDASGAGASAQTSDERPDASIGAAAPSRAIPADGRSPIAPAPSVAVDAALAALRPRYRQCVARGLERDPTMPKAITITITGGPKGSGEIAVTTTPVVAKAVTDCIADVTKSVAVPVGSTVTVRIVLEPQGT